MSHPSLPPDIDMTALDEARLQLRVAEARYWLELDEARRKRDYARGAHGKLIDEGWARYRGEA